MFQKGEKIVCIKHSFNGLEVGKTYTITEYYEDKHVVRVAGFTDRGFLGYQFISLVEYRKLKIEKIKERIKHGVVR